MTKILNLQDVIDMQKTVEKLIISTQAQIIANNPVLKGESSEVDVLALYEKYELLLDQLNILKLVKHKANSKKLRLGGKTHQETILDLSIMQRKQAMLEDMFMAKNQNRKGKRQPAWDFQMTKKDIEDKIDTITNKVSKIKQSMKKFNKNTRVKVIIFEELDL